MQKSSNASSAPYWWCRNRGDLATADSPSNLALERGVIEQPICFWKTECRALKSNPGNIRTLKLTMPYLTNPAPIKAGAWIFLDGSFCRRAEQRRKLLPTVLRRKLLSTVPK